MIRWIYNGGFAAAQRDLRNRATDDQLSDAVRVTSFQTEREVKTAMPIDTGRARNSWGHGPESIWTVSDGGLTIEQGSNVHYIGGLNEGSSRQAPAGFIDAIARRALSRLIRNVESLVRF